MVWLLLSFPPSATVGPERVAESLLGFLLAHGFVLGTEHGVGITGALVLEFGPIVAVSIALVGFAPFLTGYAFVAHTNTTRRESGATSGMGIAPGYAGCALFVALTTSYEADRSLDGAGSATATVGVEPVSAVVSALVVAATFGALGGLVATIKEDERRRLVLVLATVVHFVLVAVVLAVLW